MATDPASRRPLTDDEYEFAFMCMAAGPRGRARFAQLWAEHCSQKIATPAPAQSPGQRLVGWVRQASGSLRRMAGVQ
jgi:hypothetical protein